MTQPLRKLQNLAIIAIVLLPGCASVQYSALEKVGVHKRDILIDKVEEARDAQTDTRDKLVSAYDELSSLIGYDGGQLDAQYTKLNKAVERSAGARDRLDDRLQAIDRVSKDLFGEWEEELKLYQSATLKADQTTKFKAAKTQYAAMRARMQTARDRVDPVMSVLNDNVLFLKHSLNAQALAALKGQAASLKTRVDALIRDMQKAIDDANAFIAQMGAG